MHYSKDRVYVVGVPESRVWSQRIADLDYIAKQTGDYSLIDAERNRIVSDHFKALASPLGGYRGAAKVHGTPEARKARRDDYRLRYAIHAARLTGIGHGQLCKIVGDESDRR